MMMQPATSFAPASPAVTRVGRFYVTRELGRGTVGCVYLGHDSLIARDIAIKTVHPRLTPAERSRQEQQFVNEARAAGRLSHPNIVTIYEASIDNGAAYIAMEYLQGRELSKLLNSGYRFTPHEVASICWKIADALDHAHARDVVHRDIKPANIFMVNDEQPKLMDFGIARCPNRIGETREPDETYTIFRSNRLLGTPNYMSPEQALQRPADARSDIYSLGAVMYEMLVGRKPFHADSADKLLQQIAYKAPPAPHELDARIPTVLSRIVMKAMSKRPEKRYQSAGKMALDIRRFLQHERRARRLHISIPSMERHEPPAEQARRHDMRPMIWLAIAAVAIAGTAALALLH